MPAGKLSVKLSVLMLKLFGLVMVMRNNATSTPSATIVFAGLAALTVKVFATVKAGAFTVRVALAAKIFWVAGVVAVSAPTARLLVFVPETFPTTSTFTVHFCCAADVPAAKANPVKLMLVPPATAVTVPVVQPVPPKFCIFGVLAITSPVCVEKSSVKLMPEYAVVVLLVIFKVKVVTPPTFTDEAKLLLSSNDFT